MRNRWLNTEPKQPEYYAGILVHADTGLHDQMRAMVEANLPRGSRVLDLGAGAGAFTKRLLDSGYDVTPVDIEAEKWALPDVPLTIADLNSGVPAELRGIFDAVVAMEVIEHVENPWEFFRTSAAMLRPGGLLFLSTPNVASFYSRAIFLVRGRLHQFDTPDLEYGHINPLVPFELETIAAREGWIVRDHRPGGYLPVFDLSAGGVRSAPGNVLRGIAYLIARGPKEGWCSMYAFERSAPTE